jgi:hypothetical protein
MVHTPLRTAVISNVHAPKRTYSADKALTFVPFFGILSLPIRCTGQKEIAG